VCNEGVGIAETDAVLFEFVRVDDGGVTFPVAYDVQVEIDEADRAIVNSRGPGRDVDVDFEPVVAGVERVCISGIVIGCLGDRDRSVAT
jgi:hypothetical protein